MESVWKENKPKFYLGDSEGILAQILAYRGIVGEDDVFNFISPDEQFLHSPKIMRNMIQACELIVHALKKGWRIVISGDPDVDGVTTATMLYKYLTSSVAREKGLSDLKSKIKIIYSQREDGHGISTQLTLDTDSEKRQALNTRNRQRVAEADLLIIVDSSSNDVDGAQLIREVNPDVNVIIFDHHDIELDNIEDVDKEIILVNPQHEDDEYPNKDLSGAGVVWKAISLLDEMMEIDEAYLYLDLCAVGMIGDVMRVDNLENRYLMLSGLDSINNVGLNRIYKGAQRDPKMTTLNGDDVGFTVAPIINASARLGEIELAYVLLTTDDDKKAMKTRLSLVKMNEKRKEKQIEFFNRYKDEAESLAKEHNVIILPANDSDKGYNGLIAQQFAEEFQKPCFMGKVGSDDMFRGSGRSFNGINTQAFFNQFDYAQATGHPEAHGVEFPMEKLNEIYEKADVEVVAKSTEITYNYDVVLTLDEVLTNMEDLVTINRLTGRGFPNVNVVVRDVDIESREIIGSKKNTAKFKSLESDFQFLKFHVDEEYGKDIDYLSTVDVLGTANMNKFYHGGLRKFVYTPQLLLTDIKEK